MFNAYEIKCSDCGHEVHPLEVFPQNRCLQCHKAIVDKQPLEKPDFTKAINVK